MVTRAGVTQHEFEQEFASADDCLLATFDFAATLLSRATVEAVQGEREWLTRVRAGVVRILSFLDAEPRWARLLMIEAAGPSLLERRDLALSRLADLLERGCPSAENAGLALQRGLTAELVVGGVFSVVSARMLKHTGAPLVDLAPSLMSLIVLPYLGADAAKQELAFRPPPRPAPVKDRAQRQALPVRSTYRTALVLNAIAASPYASNRDIASAADLGDEGQTSKLLGRLQRQGLIENTGLGQAYGEPNAWVLTSEGRRAAQLLGQDFALHTGQERNGARRRRPTCQA